MSCAWLGSVQSYNPLVACQNPTNKSVGSGVFIATALAGVFPGEGRFAEDAMSSLAIWHSLESAEIAKLERVA